MTTHSTSKSHLNALPTHRMALAMEEFPQLVSRAQACERARSISRKRTQFICGKIIEEVDEDVPYPVDEDKAWHSFLQSLESLRRCILGRQ